MDEEKLIPVEDKDSPFADNDLNEEQQSFSDEQRAAREQAVKEHAIAEEVLDWLRTICIGVIAGVLIVVFVLQKDNVYGDSMMPTLNSGDVVFTQKITTYTGAYERGDIVILNGQGMDGYTKSEYLVKRVVGLPGETIKIEDGNVYIKPADGKEFYVLEESYLPEGTKTTMMEFGLAKGYNEVTLGPDEYFCLGDNRPVSNDSRNLGPFSKDRIVAVAFVRIYPLSGFKLL